MIRIMKKNVLLLIMAMASAFAGRPADIEEISVSSESITLIPVPEPEMLMSDATISTGYLKHRYHDDDKQQPVSI